MLLSLFIMTGLRRFCYFVDNVLRNKYLNTLLFVMNNYYIPSFLKEKQPSINFFFFGAIIHAHHQELQENQLILDNLHMIVTIELTKSPKNTTDQLCLIADRGTVFDLIYAKICKKYSRFNLKKHKQHSYNKTFWYKNDYNR